MHVHKYFYEHSQEVLNYINLSIFFNLFSMCLCVSHQRPLDMWASSIVCKIFSNTAI